MRCLDFVRGVLVLVLPLGCLLGCKKPAGPGNAPAPAAPRQQQAAVLHWVGKTRLEADTNAAYQVNLWNLPESQTLQNMALDKLTAFLSAGARPPEATLTNALNALTRPLLKDLLQQESFSGLWLTTNGQVEAGLAIRLSPERSAFWRTTLAVALEGATTKKPIPDARGGWRAEPRPGTVVEFGTNANWTLIAGGAETGQVLSNLAARLPADTVATAPGTNSWLEGTFDLNLLAKMGGASVALQGNLPTITFTMHGDGEYVRSRAQLAFPKPVGLDMDNWSIPTNWVREPIITFTALRGVRPWLQQLGWLEKLHLSGVPNQFFAWALSSSYVHSFQAAPLTNAVAEMDRVGPGLVQDVNSWLTNQAMGSVRFSREYHGMVWMPVPMFTPAFLAVDDPSGGLLIGSLCGAQPPPGDPGPAELFSRVTGPANLVYYDWEITEARVRHWILLGQSARLAFHRPQLPIDGVGIKFLNAMAPKLGNTATEITAPSPTTLNFVRKSHGGFTGFELHLLADWIESPEFPRGLHTLSAEATPVLRYRAATRSFEPVTNAPANRK